MAAALQDSILAYTDGRTGTNGLFHTDVDALKLIRGDRETPLQHAFYEPSLIVVVQGTKEMLLGDACFTYTAGQYLVLSIGLPVLAGISDAGPDRPYLALALTIDQRLIDDLAAQIGGAPEGEDAASRLGLFVGTLDARQADAVGRLVALLATPDALRVLYPSIAREIFYWLLTGPDGPQVRRLAAPERRTQRIAEAINVLRADVSESVSVERLAAIAHMSVSSFHAHFKAVTSMSPLQYQKQLRLLEARRLMLSDGADATRAAYEVGYESASQFSREYARMFGAPPRRDVAGLRTIATSSHALLSGTSNEMP